MRIVTIDKKKFDTIFEQRGFDLHGSFFRPWRALLEELLYIYIDKLDRSESFITFSKYGCNFVKYCQKSSYSSYHSSEIRGFC